MIIRVFQFNCGNLVIHFSGFFLCYTLLCFFLNRVLCCLDFPVTIMIILIFQ